MYTQHPPTRLDPARDGFARPDAAVGTTAVLRGCVARRTTGKSGVVNPCHVLRPFGWRRQGCQGEGAALGIPTDGPLITGVDDRAAELSDAIECLGHFGDGEVRKGGGIPRAEPTLVQPQAEVLAAGLPPGSRLGRPRRQLEAKHSVPEAAGTRDVVSWKLDQGREHHTSMASGPHTPIHGPRDRVTRSSLSSGLAQSRTRLSTDPSRSGANYFLCASARTSSSARRCAPSRPAVAAQARWESG